METSLEKKIDKLMELYQKFGLQFIQSIGELKHSNEVLIKKMESIEKGLLDLKGLKIQLQEVVRLKDSFQSSMNQIERYFMSISNKLEGSINSFQDNSVSKNSTEVSAANSMGSTENISEPLTMDLKNLAGSNNIGGSGDKNHTAINKVELTEIFNVFEEKIKNVSDVQTLISTLDALKEKLYLKVGGGMTLFKIGEFIRSLKKQNELTGNLRNDVLNHLDEWKKQLL